MAMTSSHRSRPRRQAPRRRHPAPPTSTRSPSASAARRRRTPRRGRRPAARPPPARRVACRAVEHLDPRRAVGACGERGHGHHEHLATGRLDRDRDDDAGTVELGRAGVVGRRDAHVHLVGGHAVGARLIRDLGDGAGERPVDAGHLDGDLLTDLYQVGVGRVDGAVDGESRTRDRDEPGRWRLADSAFTSSIRSGRIGRNTISPAGTVTPVAASSVGEVGGGLSAACGRGLELLRGPGRVLRRPCIAQSQPGQLERCARPTPTLTIGDDGDRVGVRERRGMRRRGRRDRGGTCRDLGLEASDAGRLARGRR